MSAWLKFLELDLREERMTSIALQRVATQADQKEYLRYMELLERDRAQVLLPK